MNTSLVGLLALVIGLAVLLAALRGVLQGKKAPRFTARRLQTENEEEFFRRLLRAVPEMFVFPQVSMSALMEAKAGNQQDRLNAFRRISQKRVDWVICDEALNVVCVVELDDATHNAKHDVQRDQYLKSAGIDCLRWNSRGRPTSGEIRERVHAVYQAHQSGRTVQLRVKDKA